MAASPSAEVQEDTQVSSTTPADTEVVLDALASEASQPVIEEVAPSYLLQLEDDPSSWYRVLREKAEENPQFHNVLTSFAGRSRQSMEVAKLKAEKAEIERQRDLAIIAAQEAHLSRMEPTQQAEFLAKNPEIAMRLRDKEKLSQPVAGPNQYEEEIRESYVGLIEEMRLNGLPENWVAELHQRASSGAYANAPDGSQRSPLQQLRAIEKDQRLFVSKWQEHRASTRPAAASRPAAAATTLPIIATTVATPQSNPRLTGSGPDPSSRGAGSIRTQDKMTRSEYASLSRAEKNSRWPTAESFQKAVSDGLFID